MSPLKRNIIANFVGKSWNAFISLALVPVYIQYIGIEAYGLVGVFATLQAIFLQLDMGLSMTLNRELARLSGRLGKDQEAHDLVRTLEIIYWMIAGVIALVLLSLSSLIASYWLNPQQLTDSDIRYTLLLMGLIITFQFPFFLYSGGLQGLEQQVLLNVLTTTVATVRGLGAIAILALVSPTIQSFFIWQLIVTIIQTACIRHLLWKRLPTIHRSAQFQPRLIHGVSRFAVGITGISLLALLLMHLDKIVLSKLLALENFGYYSLATVASSGLSVMIVPIFSAAFPRLSHLVSTNNEAHLIWLYHRSCQLMAVVILPVAFVLSFFSQEIMLLWTRDPGIVEHTHRLLSLLAIGTALNGLMNIPYALQLAYGWTKLALYQNLVAVILLVPCLFWATIHFGATGAASVWVILNTAYILVGIQIMHTKLLKSEKRSWYYRDVFLPAIGALIAASIGRWLLPGTNSIAVLIIWLLIVFVFTVSTAALLTPLTQEWLKQFMVRNSLRI